MHNSKFEKYEIIYVRIILFLLPVLSISVFYKVLNNLCNGFFCIEIVTECVSYLQILFLGFVKYRFIKYKILLGMRSYVVIKVIEFISVVAATIVHHNHNIWAYLLMLALIITTIMSRGYKLGLTYSILAICFHLFGLILYESLILRNGFNVLNIGDLDFHINQYFVIILVSFLITYIYSEYKKSVDENTSLLHELSQKYNQVETAQKEIQHQYEISEQTNSKLEETNNKLRTSIAEFFTIQHVTQAISSIFEPIELLKNINDIILGVLGVSSSTIILYDEKKNKLHIEITNIKDDKELDILNKHINCDFLMDVLDKAKLILDNDIDENIHKFVKGRGVKSMICLPLTVKEQKYGIVILEQTYKDAFKESQMRILDIIAKQISIAVENASLYKKMRDMATIDGLTGVYNRLYFQQRLKDEIVRAKENNYVFSLVIFDIDFFKKFNDTYGHLFGDEVLKTIAHTVRKTLRKDDVFARFGGEEFIILLPNTEVMEAFNIIESLRCVIENTTVKEGNIVASVTSSFGISEYPNNATTDNRLIKNADDALYEAKKSGRNCTKIFAELMSV